MPEAAVSFQSNDPHKVSREARGWVMRERRGGEKYKERSYEEYCWIMVRWHTEETRQMCVIAPPHTSAC